MIEEPTVKLLNFLAKKGLGISEKKVQLAEEKVKHLRHIFSGGL